MNVIKKIVVGFFIFHFTFLSLIYLNLYRLGQADLWISTGSFNYLAIVLSYIPILALIEYFIFYFVLKLINLKFSVRVTLVALLTTLVNSSILYFQSKEILIAGMTAISTLLMSLILPFIKTKRTDS
ncbi:MULTISPECIES: hypothetical protein [Bacillus]|uniref:Uncharacterized protein n=1 Tax=Bacillus glycinifermentans TaxID=1664069 RepID=A0AAJ4D286_9BACI|nr:hypothetical protein [Bacillus glycinifermentans]KKB71943.1 hypothetical protein TH62_20295 [Bacillus sp. TH008]MDU0069874.1 hypothetical protein [Bacillus sp. IG6]HWO77779.1 hypothetical protein [Bacillus sp. (in: firmicutes)]MED8020934.1 hypothetical protein [Bacillus glycinifermentans]QAT65293.1 hypothetical protein EQZ20_10400 [Bacillus glycinifermentans]